MMRKCFATLLILIFVLSWISGCANLDVKIDNVYIVSNAVKYLQDEEVPDTGADRLTARLAKNEAEGMQFIVKPNQTISNVKMTVSELKDGQGNQFAAENVEAFRQYYIDTQPTSPEYESVSGMIPDALIPLVYEDLNSVDVEAGKNQGFWITVTAPKDQPAGVYTGSVTLTYDGGVTEIPVEVEVWDFELPDEPSFASAYGLWDSNAWKYMTRLGATEGVEYYDFVQQYYEFLLNYRVTPTSLPFESTGAQDPVAYAEKIIRFLQEHPRASGFQLHLNVSDLIETEQAPQWFITVCNILRENGVLDKAFTYMFDEPGDTGVINDRIKTAVAAVRSGVPDIRNLITTAPRESLYGVVDPWCGIWSSKTLMENEVRDRQALGEEVWWYGCVGPRAPYPTYHTPDALMSSRLVHWMQKDWNIQGNLYWATMLTDKLNEEGDAFDAERNIWSDPNVIDQSPGDGYLVYVGAKNDGVINRNIPVPTLRLESIRDGSEDFEYLTILQNQIEQTLQKWGITDVTADQIMDTYYAPLYNTMGDFDRNPEQMLKMRERVAHDIMNPEAIVAVFAELTTENPNMRKVTVYAEPGAEVSIDGQTVSGEEKGAYSEYSYVFDMNVEPDFKDIEVVVNGETYGRTLKSIEDYEYMELGEAVVMENVQALGIPEDLVSMREMYDANMFQPIEEANIGSLQDQLSADGNSARVPILISDDESYAMKVKDIIVGEVNSSIPLVIQNIPSDSVGSTEELTLYVPAGADVSVNGEKAEHIQTTDRYSQYYYPLNCGDEVDCFYTVTIVYNDQSETLTKLVKNKVKAAYSLLDLNDPDLFSNLQEANSDPEESATITAVTKEGVETSCADGSVSLAMMIFDTNSIAGHLQDFTPYNVIRVEITNTGAETTDGVKLLIDNGMDQLESATVCGPIDPGQTKIVYFKIPEMREASWKTIQAIILRPMDEDTTQTYRIKSISAVHHTEFE